MVVASAVLQIPYPAAWLVTGAVWTAIGLWQYAALRSDDAPKAMAG
jgi:hypothetical protein